VADLLPLLVLTLGIALLRPAALAPAAEPDRTIGRRQLLGTGAALVGLCTVFLVTAVPMSNRWTQARNVRYVKNLRAGVAELDRRGGWSLYTTYLPGAVSSASAGYYSQTTTVAALVTGHPVSADDLSEPMYVVDADGHLRPARFRSLASTAGFCSSGPQQLLQPLSRSLPRTVWNVQLSYRVSTPTTLRFAIDPGTGRPIEATGLSRAFPVSGSGQLAFALRPSAIAGLRLDVTAAGACISDVRIGRPVPA
jgi:hypothetical protein